jgi:hypothetical protein
MPIEATQARWQTLVGVLYILDGGGVGEGVWSVLWWKLCKGLSIPTALSKKLLFSCKLSTPQLLLNSICTQPDVVTKISHSGPGQYSIVHLCRLFVDASFHLVCVSNPTIPLPNYSSCTNMYAQKSRATFIPLHMSTRQNSGQYFDLIIHKNI